MFNPNFFERVKTVAVDKSLKIYAEQINKSCPVKVDEYTQLNFIDALPNRILKYDYTLAVDKSQVDPNLFNEQIESQLINNIQNNPQMEMLRNNKTTFIHVYKDLKGNGIAEIEITPEEYEQ